MLKNKQLFIALIAAFSLLSNSVKAKYDYDCCYSPFYLRAEIGGSFSSCADICADPRAWDPAQEGYNNDLGRAPFAGFAFGYNINSYISFGANFTYRGPFNYCKRQTPITTSGETPAFLGNKTRFFDVENNSFMLELFFNRTGSENSYFSICQGALAPYLGFGIGWSRTIVSNFHSVTEQNVTINDFTTNRIASAMTYKVDSDFAWQISLGFDYNINECIALGLGYRFFDARCFKTNNYVVDNLPDFEDAVNLPAWTGKLRTNELIANFTINF